MKEEQQSLFDLPEPWEEHWQGMPEYNQTKLAPIRTIKINFLTQEDLDAFAALIGQKIHAGYENYWFPKLNIKTHSKDRYEDDES
jgi:hypothetical protein